VTCPVAGKWHDRNGPKQPVCSGALIAMIGLISIAALGPGVSPGGFVWYLLIPFAFIGVGMGLGIVGLSTTVMNGVGEELLGAGAAANALVARLAAAIAVGTFGIVLLCYGVDMQSLNANDPQWKPAIQFSMGLAATICAAVFIGAALTLTRRSQKSALSLNRDGGLPS
jgi:MFS family permease